jgi:8-oxo-dGTP diphosphatase
MTRTQLATLCYVSHRGKTLMLHRVKKIGDVHIGKWNGLGGKFMPGESPEGCVIREVKEECGLSIKKPSLRGVIMFPSFTPGTDWMVFVYTATRFSGKIHDTDEGVLRWIPSNKISRLPLWEGDRIFLKWLKGRPFFSARFVYKNKKFKGHSVVFHG